MALTTAQLRAVRTLIPDKEAIFDGEYMFSDEDLQDLSLVAGTNLYKVAGLAMLAVGNSEALIEKVIKTQDLSTNGAALQDSWRAAAKVMLDRGDAEDAAANAFDGFQIIDYRQGWGTWPAELTEFDENGDIIDQSAGYGRGGYGE